MKIISQSRKATCNLGRLLVSELLKTAFASLKQALVVGLEGDLGSGKTLFVQAMARELQIKEEITSPTFVILKRYKIETKQKSRFKYLYHIDCYRINKSEDLMGLGFKEILNNPHNIIAIEWAEKVKKILPKNTLWLKFRHKGGNKREIILSYHPTKPLTNS